MITSPNRFMITGKTKLLGVIGHPIEHSLSPVMHNAAIAALGVDYVYLPFPIDPINLRRALDGFEVIGLQGFSVTIPHKQAIMPLLNEISETAKAIGAVNTVCRTASGWYGTNTDLDGFLAPLQSQNWAEATALILGNGGAARAVVAGCYQIGCRQIHVVGRDRQKLKTFWQSWQDHPVSAHLFVAEWQELPDRLSQANLLVNTTPIGMAPDADRSPIDPALLEKLPAGAIAYDLIYTPRPTKFLQQAAAQGCVAIDGLEMLVQQGAVALQLWLKQSVPVEVMRSALLDFLR
ncbi:shikimate dehydrogenase [Leptolyngbya sp. FACHB-711]|uniref:shikimate dehydrogenase n=2 Tax=Leptolyngbya TaxID=47251 RepID=UPI001F54F0FF|nr:shikimate dehydrogenase [Leptolyngbya sp. FACHB-711]